MNQRQQQQQQQPDCGIVRVPCAFCAPRARPFDGSSAVCAAHEQEEEECVPVAKYAAVCRATSLPLLGLLPGADEAPQPRAVPLPLPRPARLCSPTKEQRQKESAEPVATPGCLLPTVRGYRHTAFPSVSVHTVAALLRGALAVPEGRSVLVVDCRFPFEFEGGHIRGAVNVTVPDAEAKLRRLLRQESRAPHSRILLFHCEFSQNRSPRAMELLRRLDRNAHASTWPHVDFDEMYLINDGYQAFHRAYPELCVPPGAYVPMRAPEHRDQLRACLELASTSSTGGSMTSVARGGCGGCWAHRRLFSSDEAAAVRGSPALRRSRSALSVLCSPDAALLEKTAHEHPPRQRTAGDGMSTSRKKELREDEIEALLDGAVAVTPCTASSIS